MLTHGIALGIETWRAFLDRMGWSGGEVDKVICHQVGSAHRETILKALDIPESKDFATYPFLGNTGTVALPITAATRGRSGISRARRSSRIPRYRQRAQLFDAGAGVVSCR